MKGGGRSTCERGGGMLLKSEERALYLKGAGVCI